MAVCPECELDCDDLQISVYTMCEECLSTKPCDYCGYTNCQCDAYWERMQDGEFD